MKAWKAIFRFKHNATGVAASGKGHWEGRPVQPSFLRNFVGQDMYYVTEYVSPLGMLTLASDGNALTGLWMEGQKYFGGAEKEEKKQNGNLPVFKMAIDWLDRYFAGMRPGPSELPLAPAGGSFRQEVWKILCEIPYGQVVTYREIAKKMAVILGKSSMSGQAVGQAVGHNPISIIIPCHRVVGANGSLTGYAGGIARKAMLLELEGVEIKGAKLNGKNL